jgi:hypothetical protein
MNENGGAILTIPSLFLLFLLKKVVVKRNYLGGACFARKKGECGSFLQAKRATVRYFYANNGFKNTVPIV